MIGFCDYTLIPPIKQSTTMLDWYNIGFSLITGFIWILAYKKSGHMISSIIAHGGTNLAGILWLLVMSGVN